MCFKKKIMKNCLRVFSGSFFGGFVFCSMLPKVILGERPVYAAVSVPSGDFFLWTHVRKGKWLVCLSDVEHIWQESFDAEERHQLDEPNTSLQNYLGHFCDSVIAGSTHVQQFHDEDNTHVVLSVWRYGSGGEQVKSEYALNLITNNDKRTRMVKAEAIEMARRCSQANEDEEIKAKCKKNTRNNLFTNFNFHRNTSKLLNVLRFGDVFCFCDFVQRLSRESWSIFVSNRRAAEVPLLPLQPPKTTSRNDKQTVLS
jgi:hypothetical protein